MKDNNKFDLRKLLVVSMMIVFVLNIASCCKKKVESNLTKGKIWVTGELQVNGGKRTVTQWLDGTTKSLSNGLETCFAVDNKVINGDQFVIGFYNKSLNGNNLNKAVYWKNGVEFAIQSTNASSTPIAIANDGNNIYILCDERKIGSYNCELVLYKNGTVDFFTTLTNGGCSDLEIENGNVHILGYGLNGSKMESIYFKNQNPTFLKPTVGNGLYARDMVIINGKAFITGSETTNNSSLNSFLWSDNIFTILNASESIGEKIANLNGKPIIIGRLLSGSKPYVVTWYNGIETKLPELDNTTGYSSVSDIAIYEDKSYILGSCIVNNGIRKNVIWIDGSINTTVGDTTGSVDNNWNAISVFK
jgi:hypothetical protein